MDVRDVFSSQSLYLRLVALALGGSLQAARSRFPAASLPDPLLVPPSSLTLFLFCFTTLVVFSSLVT